MKLVNTLTLAATGLYLVLSFTVGTATVVLRGNDASPGGDSPMMQQHRKLESPEECLAANSNNFDYCGCLEQGRNIVVCRCLFVDKAGNKGYCEGCLGALAASQFDLGNIFDEKSVMQVAETGEYKGAKAIVEYINYISSTFFKSITPIGHPFLKILPATNHLCTAVLATNDRFELNTNYFTQSCLQTVTASVVTFVPKNDGTGITVARVNTWIPVPFYESLYGSMIPGSTADWLCEIMKNTCQGDNTPKTWEFNGFDKSNTKCNTEYSALPTTTGGSYLDGHSLGCKVLHATLAQQRNLHCPHASIEAQLDENGDIKCQASAEIDPMDIFGDLLDFFRGVSRGVFGYGENYFDTCGGGGSGGDPHILSWAHQWFDYMGQCDLMLVNAPSFARLGLTAEIRTKARHAYSYIQAAAIRIGEEDIFEVTGFGQYILNGVMNAKLPATISGFPILHEFKGKDHHLFTIDLGAHGSVVLKSYKDLVGIKFDDVLGADLNDSVGLMGSFGNGTHFARDGMTILDDPNEFGQEWQLQDNEPQLFTTKALPGKCILPSPKTDASRKLGETISHEEAEQACANNKEAFEQCVYDVIATGDLGVAYAGGAF